MRKADLSCPAPCCHGIGKTGDKPCLQGAYILVAGARVYTDLSVGVTAAIEVSAMKAAERRE